MQWEFLIVLFIAVPVVLIPVALVWYLSLGGIYQAIRESRRRKTAHEEQPVVTDLISGEHSGEDRLVGTRH